MIKVTLNFYILYFQDLGSDYGS